MQYLRYATSVILRTKYDFFIIVCILSKMSKWHCFMNHLPDLAKKMIDCGYQILNLGTMLSSAEPWALVALDDLISHGQILSLNLVIPSVQGVCIDSDKWDCIVAYSHIMNQSQKRYNRKESAIRKILSWCCHRFGSQLYTCGKEERGMGEVIRWPRHGKAYERVMVELVRWSAWRR